MVNFKEIIVLFDEIILSEALAVRAETDTSYNKGYMDGYARGLRVSLQMLGLDEAFDTWGKRGKD